MNIHEALAQVLAQQTTLVDLVARLTSCVQKLEEEVDSLKTKVETLEHNGNE